MSKVYIVAAKRTAIGKFLGGLSTVSPSQFGAEVVKTILEDTKVPKEKIDEVIVGHILTAGQGAGIGRQVSIYAGIPAEVPAYSINMQCGSGMKAVMNGYANIKNGWHHLVVAGGTESMSQAPMILPNKVRTGVRMGNVTAYDHMIKDGLEDVFNNYHMGVTAENIAKNYDISREAQDEFAFDSQCKAVKAVREERFKDEIVPIEVKTRKETLIFDTDEFPNARTSVEKLSKLRPAFLKEGSVTAGNASGINDGASFMLLASEEAVKEYNLNPLCEVIGIGQGGVDPSIMGMGPVPAVKSVLNYAGMKLQDMELMELNEAFAAQSLGVIEQLSRDHKMTKEDILAITNVNGGAIALGHPVGASGNRIITTLIYEMKKQSLTYGLATLCIGGGMGTAVIIKMEENK